MSSEFKNILAIDYGEARLGLARASSVARLPEPLGVAKNDEGIFTSISSLLKEHGINYILVGLPRNMSGEETAQSQKCRAFAAELSKQTGLEVELVDETLTTATANELIRRSDSKLTNDEVAAMLILDDFFRSTTT